MKKRFLALSLALAMCLAMLTGCGGGNDAMRALSAGWP